MTSDRGIAVAGALVALLVAAPTAAQPPDSLAVTVVNGTGEPLTDVSIFFAEEDNLLAGRLADGDSVVVRVPADGCLFHVFGGNRKTKHDFRRYALDLCREKRVTLTAGERTPTGDTASDADVAAVLDVYLAGVASNFEGLVDVSDPPDDEEYDLRFYFPPGRIADHYFVRQGGGRFVLRLELRTVDDRSEARSALADACRWLEGLPLAAGPLRAGTDEDPDECRLVASTTPVADAPEMRVMTEPLPRPDRRIVVVAEIPGRRPVPR